MSNPNPSVYTKYERLMGERNALTTDNHALRVEIAQWRAERDALAAELAKYKALWDSVIAHKDDTFQCPQCGYAEDWWTDSNADYSTRKILEPTQSSHAATSETDCGDPNPLDPTNHFFRKCLKGHVAYSTSFTECPSCKILRERSTPEPDSAV